MSNNKFHFEFKREFLNIGFFSLHVQKKNYSYCLSLEFILLIFLNFFLNYSNRCKLLTFTQTIERPLSTCMSTCSKASI